MRGSPPIEVTVNRFGFWRGAVCGLAIASIASIAAWGALSRGQQHAVAILGVFIGALAIAAIALRECRAAPLRLRWDGAAWQLTEGRPGLHQPCSGELRVAMDLGFWMLLRFVAEVPTGRLRTVWVPVQRRELQAQWHGLRCAVYSPQAAADDT